MRPVAVRREGGGVCCRVYDDVDQQTGAQDTTTSRVLAEPPRVGSLETAALCSNLQPRSNRNRGRALVFGRRFWGGVALGAAARRKVEEAQRRKYSYQQQRARLNVELWFGRRRPDSCGASRFCQGWMVRVGRASISSS